METAVLSRQFERMGARVAVAPGRGRARVSVDIRRDVRGQFFLVQVNPQTPLSVEAVDVRPRERHLLLMVADPVGAARRDKQKFLCGHDEREWFVAAVPEARGVSDVRTAMEALKPAAVLASQARAGVRFKDRNRRKNAGFLRQGEWFFLPRPDLDPSGVFVFRNEPIRRGRGKPHRVEELVRVGGETVYVSDRFPNGLLAHEYRAYLDANPWATAHWRVMRRNARVYARGRVSHPDHKTIVLPFWHEVAMNTESESRAMASVAFLD